MLRLTDKDVVKWVLLKGGMRMFFHGRACWVNADNLVAGRLALEGQGKASYTLIRSECSLCLHVDYQSYMHGLRGLQRLLDAMASCDSMVTFHDVP